MRAAPWILAAFMAVGAWAGPVKAPEDPVSALRRETAQDLATHGLVFDAIAEPPAALLRSFEGKRLVGIGSTARGVSELQALTWNLALAAARQRPVVVFLEDDYLALDTLHRYLQGEGPADPPEKALRSIFIDHYTLDFQAFLRRARAHNASSPHRISLYGVDIQPWSRAKEVLAPLKAHADRHGMGLDREFEACSRWMESSPEAAPPVAAAALGAAAWIQATVGLWGRPETRVEAEVLANILVHTLRRAQRGPFPEARVLTADAPGLFLAAAERAAGMAANIKILMDRKVPKGTLAFFVAHDMHTGRLGYLVNGIARTPGSWGTAGSILGNWLGGDYHVLSLQAGPGRFYGTRANLDGTSYRRTTMALPPPPPNALGALPEFQEGAGLFVPVAPVRHLDAVWNVVAQDALFVPDRPGAGIAATVPGLAYDGLVFLRESTPIQPIKH